MSRFSEQDGMTIVEVMVALVLAIGLLLGVSQLLVKGVQNSVAHERQVSADAIAEQLLEDVRLAYKRYGFEAIALSAGHTITATGSLANPDDPTAYLSASGRFKIMENWHNTASGQVARASGVSADGEALIVGGTSSYPTAGQLLPVEDLSNTAKYGNVKVRVWRFVTARKDQCRTGATCTGESRRVTVAVRLERFAGGADNEQDAVQLKKPVYLSTVFNDGTPSAGPGTNGAGVYVGLGL